MRLENRVVFVSGASRGIGRACALACAREGADVVVAAKTEIADNPRLPRTIHEGAREAAIELTVHRMGRIDALINNAGALWWADVVETPVKRFDLIMGVNVRASFVLSRAVLPHMLKQRWGHVVMMSP